MRFVTVTKVALSCSGTIDINNEDQIQSQKFSDDLTMVDKKNGSTHLTIDDSIDILVNHPAFKGIGTEAEGWLEDAVQF